MLFSFRRSVGTKSLRFLPLAGICVLLFFLSRTYLLDRAYTSFQALWALRTAPGKGIPEKFWYKLGPNGLNSELQGYIDSCLTKNPTFRHEFLTDPSGDAFVREHYTSRPDILENFLTLRIPIAKADILRYLILYKSGGIWNDLDITCEVPISDWIPEQYKEQTSIVVGLEFDEDRWVRQFASWTILAKPESPHMLTVIEDCIEAVREKSRENNVGVSDLTLDMVGDIVDFSGPRRLTNGILKSLSQTTGSTIDGNSVANVSEPRLIGDVLVMPDHSFANSMNDAFGDAVPGQALVTHHYAGSWKNDFGGEIVHNETKSEGDGAQVEA